MKINISFGKVWSIPEVKAFIADPQSPVFSALDKDAYLELASCAECYSGTRTSMTEEEMNANAKSEIAYCVDEYFYNVMCDDYVDDVLDRIKCHLSS